MIAKSNVSFSSGRMDINTQTTDTGFAFEKRDELTSFGILDSRTQISFTRVQYNTVTCDFKMLHLIVRFCIYHLINVTGLVLGQMNVIAVGAQAGSIIRFYDNVAL